MHRFHERIPLSFFTNFTIRISTPPCILAAAAIAPPSFFRGTRGRAPHLTSVGRTVGGAEGEREGSLSNVIIDIIVLIMRTKGEERDERAAHVVQQRDSGITLNRA